MVRKLIIVLFLFSIAVISYDSLPYFHFSVYRPLSMFSMFAASFLLLFTGYRFKTGDYFLVAFAMYSVAHSLIVSVGYGDTGSSFKHVITLLFGLSMYRTSVYIAEQTKEDPELIGWIAKSLMVAFIPPIFAGFLQLMDSLVLHSGFSMPFTGLFSEKVYKGRIQLLSGEPSWGAIHMLSGGLLMFFLYKRGFRKQLPLLIGTAVLLVLSFSAYAYSVLLTAMLIYVLIANKNRGKMLLVLGVCVLVVAVGVPYLLETFHVSGYFTERFQFNFNHLIKTDNSMFIRVYFPAIGFIEFAQHPVFGVGGGFYYREFADLLLRHFSDGLKFKEVADLVFDRPDMATSRNLLSKVFAEEGLIGAVLIGGFMAAILKSAGKSPYAKFAFALCVALVMNFDSYSFVNFWLLIGFIRGGFFQERPAVLAAASDTQSMKGMKRIA
ncbi:O-antigen ligase family protein [Paenibacillus sp. MWE-103]|uniref:O-antigen ligase family protein n=1 Tax=Paenibacillus artemisiicola TaxID=1172618 RepID=A0ABS3W9C6_9BACL|nr:O-antigen ligase family protein [Paenibacillus artemisiicola]MBO7744917.1 O-antigen ligase family protein [Paenibacillus artemisiicola]